MEENKQKELDKELHNLFLEWEMGMYCSFWEITYLKDGFCVYFMTGKYRYYENIFYDDVLKFYFKYANSDEGLTKDRLIERMLNSLAWGLNNIAEKEGFYIDMFSSSQRQEYEEFLKWSKNKNK